MATFSWGKTGRGINVNGSLLFDFYGKNFNPNIPAFPSGWTSASIYYETTTFNLTGFQPGNEVGCYMWYISGITKGSLYVESMFQVYKSGGWTTTWSYSRSFTETNEGTYDYIGYMYFGIDSDEIWDDSTQYRIVTNREFKPDGGSSQGENGIITNFYISGLSIDSTLCLPGYLWIEGNYLCYTDSTGGDSGHYGYGFKHKINYDTGYSGGSGDAGYIWIPSSSSDKHIYYTDAYGVVRRTHESDEWYGGESYPSGAKTGNIRVSDGDYRYGYGYLCYIDGSGQQRRMGNGAP